MIELIIVLVVVSILAVMAIPRLNRDRRVEAINHILMMIRYTQNLALHDDKHNISDSRWQRAFWRFGINRCSDGGLYYYIGSDDSPISANRYNGSIDNGESAIDPSNGKYLNYQTFSKCSKSKFIPKSISPNIFITQKYGISSVKFKNCYIINSSGNRVKSTSKHIGFDNFGRAIKSYTNSNQPTHSGLLVNNCEIEFKFDSNSIAPFTIVVPKETGFAYLKENSRL